MPSSHAQFVSFFALTLTLFLLVRRGPDVPTGHTALAWRMRAGCSVLALGGAAAVSVSRIYLGYHTPRQVLVGGGAGLVFAVGWFGFTTWVRRGLLDRLLDLDVARRLRLRDLAVAEDLVEVGWDRWQAVRREKMLARRQEARSKSQ